MKVSRMFEIISAAEGVRYTSGKFYLAVDDDALVLKHRAGRAPTGEELIFAVVCLMRAYEDADGPIERPRREYPTRFLVELDRDSGSEVCYLEEEVDQGYPVKRKILSTSWGGKAELVGDTSIYDVLDFLVAYDRIVLETATSGQQFYRFLSLDIEDEDFCRSFGLDSLVVLPPRETAKEPGWIQPGEKPRLCHNWEE